MCQLGDGATCNKGAATPEPALDGDIQTLRCCLKPREEQASSCSTCQYPGVGDTVEHTHFFSNPDLPPLILLEELPLL